MTDLKILAYLALYHSHRANSGFSYALFKHSKDLNALDDAIGHEAEAIKAWEKIVEAAGDVYNDNLMMGRERSGLSGHWKDELDKLKQGLEKLIDQRDKSASAITKDQPSIAHVPIRKAPAGKDLVIRATVTSKEPVDSVKFGCRKGADYVSTDMKQTEQFIYRAVIRGRDVARGLDYSIEARDRAGRRAKTGTIAVVVTDDNKAPQVRHEPVTSAQAGKPLTVTAQVRDASGIKWVRLRYRSVTQYQDYKSLDMVQTGGKGTYSVTVPGKDVIAKYDFMYFFEVMDNKGNGKIYPDLEKQAPYIVVKLQR